MSDEHVMQVPHPALTPIPEAQRMEVSPYKDVLPEDLDQYRAHIVHYFDNQMNRDILMLPQEDKERLFQMLQEYADVLEKIFHAGIPILEHILEKRWSAARTNPHAGIDYDHDCEIIRQYEAWKNVQKTEEQVQV
jgi:hypothetical protein